MVKRSGKIDAALPCARLRLLNGFLRYFLPRDMNKEPYRWMSNVD